MIIIDASALYPLLKRFANNPDSLAERLLEEGAAILDLTMYEIGNASIIELRRGIIDDPLPLVKSLELMVLSGLKIIRVKSIDLEDICRVAKDLELTVYDASYVYYSMKYDAKLLTNDKEILAKAHHVAVKLDEWV